MCYQASVLAIEKHPGSRIRQDTRRKKHRKEDKRQGEQNYKNTPKTDRQWGSRADGPGARQSSKRGEGHSARTQGTGHEGKGSGWKSQGAALEGEDHGWRTQEAGLEGEGRWGTQEAGHKVGQEGGDGIAPEADVRRNGTPPVSAGSPEHWDRKQELVGPLAGQA